MFTWLYGDRERLPQPVIEDLLFLHDKVTSWRTKQGDYHSVASDRGFLTEHSAPCLHKKRVDLYKEYSMEGFQFRIALEVETSTIENGYNDLLKIMQLLKSDEVDFGLILFIQNDRSSRPKLSVSQLTSSLVQGLNRVLDDYRGKLHLLHGNIPTS